MPHNVFNFHNGIVDQNANYQAERQQRHDVDGKAQIVHANKRWDHRQRQRHCSDESSPPVTQKQPHHQHRQQRAFNQQRERRLVFLFHRRDKVKRFNQFNIRVRYFQLGKRCAYAAPHIHFARAFGARYFKTHHRHAVEQCCRACLCRSVLNISQLRQLCLAGHTVVVTQIKFQLRQLGGRLYGGQCAQRLLAAANVHPPASGVHLHLPQLL